MLKNFLKGCDDRFNGLNLYMLNGLCRYGAGGSTGKEIFSYANLAR